MSEIQYVTHIQTFFSLAYARMPASKKCPTARNLLHFRCKAVLKKKIFVTARRKSAGIRGYFKGFQRSCGGNIPFKTILITVSKSMQIPPTDSRRENSYCFLTSPQQFLYFFPLPQGQGSLGFAFSFFLTGCFLSVPSEEPLVAVIFAVCSRFVSS